LISEGVKLPFRFPLKKRKKEDESTKSISGEVTLNLLQLVAFFLARIKSFSSSKKEKKIVRT
jgi:hypothetical protein